MPREFDMGDGTPPRKGEVENLRPSRRDTVKDLVLYASVIAAFAGWFWRAAREQVSATEMESVKTEMRSALSAFDRRTSAIEKDLAVTRTEVVNISKTTDRIENKLDEKRRR